jgi:hypothetical protein
MCVFACPRASLLLRGMVMQWRPRALYLLSACAAVAVGWVAPCRALCRLRHTWLCCDAGEGRSWKGTVLTVSYRMMVLDGATSRATCVDDTLAFDLAVGDFDSDARVPVGLHAALYLAPVDLPVVVVLNPELAFGEVGVPDLAIPAFAQVIVNATVTASVQQAGGARAASSGASRVSRRRCCVLVYEPVAVAVAIALFLLPPLPYTVVAAAPSPASVDAHLETVAVSLSRAAEELLHLGRQFVQSRFCPGVVSQFVAGEGELAAVGEDDVEDDVADDELAAFEAMQARGEGALTTLAPRVVLECAHLTCVCARV